MKATVVTGQQLGILGGPLYTTYKVLGAAKYAAELQGRAVYWIGTNDSDFDEIKHLAFLSADGALETAASKRGLTLELIRNGSRGAFWLEPMVEVEQGDERMAFGPVTAADVESLLDALAGDPAAHPLALGPVQNIPWLSRQQRVTFRRAGVGDPLCLENYLQQDGFVGLQRALPSPWVGIP